MPLHALSASGQDARWAFRMIRRRPMISLVIVLSIGIAIGATTGAFSVVNAFLLRSWNADGMDRIVRLRENYARPGRPADIRGFTLANLGPWRRENTVFEGIAAGTGSGATLVDGDRTARVAAGVVTANFFSVLGFRPILGRTFTEQEDAPDRRDAIVLGYSLWQSAFGGDSGVLGRSVMLNGRPRVIVGVMARGIKHPYQAELWVPIGYREDAGTNAQVYAAARLKRGVTVDRANDELDAMAARLHEANPAAGTPTGAQVTLLRPEMLGRLNRVSYLLVAAAILVLLIATANVSNLLLAQGMEQHTEVAVRTALGASRWRLARQYIAYSLILSGLGGILGAALTALMVGPLIALSPLYGAGEFDIQPRLDWTTVLFALAVTTFAGLVFGLAPAVNAFRTNAMAAMREAGRTRALSRSSKVWLRGFVVVQVALAVVLIAASGSMLRGLAALRNEPWGFERKGVLGFTASIPGYRFPDRDARLAAVTELLNDIRGMSGVVRAGATTVPPLFAGTESALFNVEGAPAQNERGAHIAHIRAVTPGYFETMGIALVSGRPFDERDNRSAQQVVIISESLARRYWSTVNVAGKRVRLGTVADTAQSLEVVGVVRSLRENADAMFPGPDVLYLPYNQSPAPGQLTVFVKASGDPMATLPGIRTASQRIDRDLAISDVATLDQRFDRFTSTERLTTQLATGLGGIGLFLAAIGIYGLLAFSLDRRLSEFGIRAALGARPFDVRVLIIRDAAVLLGFGLIVGIPLAHAARPLVDARLFATQSFSAVVFTACIVAVAATAAATFMPARRAGRISPMHALHSD